jgi:hypothetical protein
LNFRGNGGKDNHRSIVVEVETQQIGSICCHDSRSFFRRPLSHNKKFFVDPLRNKSSTMLRSALQRSGAFASRKVMHGATRSMSGKEIKFGVEGRAAMLKGVDLLADAVQVSFAERL